ncbi:MAG: hypothetical protein HMLIMOIP_001281 [Candidatus Nitrosomirales archaeon]|jgi:hypothetical protein
MSTTKREDKVQERAIDKSIDETKDSAKKVLQEVRRELPEVTSTFHDYQEQNISAIREMTDTFLESQKEVAKSMQYAMRPYAANPYLWMFWPWMHPQIVTENYVRAVTNFTDSSVAAARTSSDMVQIAMESARSSINTARENTKALSQYFVDSTRSFEEASSGAVASEKSRR